MVMVMVKVEVGAEVVREAVVVLVLIGCATGSSNEGGRRHEKKLCFLRRNLKLFSDHRKIEKLLPDPSNNPKDRKVNDAKTKY